MEEFDIYGRLVDQGVIGIVAVIAMAVAIYLYKRVEGLWGEIRGLLEKHLLDIKAEKEEKIALQAQYIEEQKEVRKEIAEIANQANFALKTFADVLNEVKQDLRGR